MATGCGICKGDFLKADPATRDSIIYDNLSYLRDGIDKLQSSEQSRDKRAIKAGSLWGFVGGFTCVGGMLGMAWVITKVFGG